MAGISPEQLRKAQQSARFGEQIAYRTKQRMESLTGKWKPIHPQKMKRGIAYDV